MKKVILNETILGLNGETLAQAGRPTMADGKVVTPQPTKILFGIPILQALLQSQTKDEAETDAKFALANTINDALKSSTPVEIDLSEADFAFAQNVMLRQPLLIKKRWYDMVERLNP